MRYHNITKDDMNNGPGLRVVLWVAGCEHNCKGCHNISTWDPKGGLKFLNPELDFEASDEIENELKKDYINGITYSGGDPLHPLNRDGISNLSFIISNLFPSKTQWLYTGYTWEEVLKLSETDENVKIILNSIDVLVDGKFEENLLSPELPWVGSSNQRVINVKESLKESKIILFK